jgi:hypothetical protein
VSPDVGVFKRHPRAGRWFHNAGAAGKFLKTKSSGRSAFSSAAARNTKAPAALVFRYVLCAVITWIKKGMTMKQQLLAAAACLFIGSPALAMTETECADMWLQADANSDGTLTAAESERQAAWMRMAEKPMAADGTMNEAMFKENCMANVFATAKLDEGAPLEGANSFTEGQAKDRVIAAGMTAPSTLTKDEKGIWRGTATEGGKSMQVAVDYKGNVVAQ